MSNLCILKGQSFKKNEQEAVKEFHSMVFQPNMSLVLFFCSSHYDLDVLAKEINLLFPKVLIVGCTSAGEIGPNGYTEHGLSGASFSSEGFTAVADVYNNLHLFNEDKAKIFVNDLLQKIESHTDNVDSRNSFAFLLIDGLSLREELAARTFQRELGSIALLGGSAGDDLKFNSTSIFCHGTFQTDSAVLILVNTAYRFKLFKSQHFVCGNERLIVTHADPKRRIVSEINGYPAHTICSCYWCPS